MKKSLGKQLVESLKEANQANSKKAFELVKLHKPIKTPHKLMCFIGSTELEVHGNQLSLGHDYLSLEDSRNSIEWLVSQLGGTVKWNK